MLVFLFFWNAMKFAWMAVLSFRWCWNGLMTQRSQVSGPAVALDPYLADEGYVAREINWAYRVLTLPLGTCRPPFIDY